MKLKHIPPTYFILSVLGMAICYFVFPNFNIIPFPLNLTGIVFIFLGLNLSGKSRKLFASHQTTHQFKESTTLISEGPFKKSRNPMYIGMVSFLLGIAFLFQNIVGIVFPLAFFLLLNFDFIPYEEKMLEKTFGEEYYKYKKQVRRWF